jgi:hypothetical protein
MGDTPEPVEPLPLEIALGSAINTTADVVVARLSALEHGDVVRPVDWQELFFQLKALWSKDAADGVDADWWDSCVLTTLAYAIAPLVKRIAELEQAEAR